MIEVELRRLLDLIAAESRFVSLRSELIANGAVFGHNGNQYTCQIATVSGAAYAGEAAAVRDWAAAARRALLGLSERFLVLPADAVDLSGGQLVERSGAWSGLIEGAAYHVYPLQYPLRIVPGETVAPPTNTAMPTISGVATVGQTLTLSEGSWTGFPYLTVQWLRNGTAISGANGDTYLLIAADLGASIAAEVTATNAGGSASVASPAVGPVVDDTAPQAFPFAADLSLRIAADTITDVADGAGIASLPIELASEAFTQTTAAARPTYVAASAYGGRPGIRFSGSQWMSADIGSLLSAVAAENYSVFVIYSDATGAGNNPGRILSASGGNGFEIFAGADAVKANAQVYEKTGIGNGFGTLGFSFQDPNSEMGNANGTGLYDCYVDGGAIWRQTANTAPAINDTTLWLGAMNSAQYYRFSGVIHEILIWSRRLTQAEMISVQKWACDKYGQPYPWADEDAYTLFSGDSLTVGVGAAAAASYPNVLMNTKGVPNGAWSMLAVGGASQNNLTSYDPGAVAAIREVVGKPVVILSHEWANQMTTGNMPSKATWFTALDAIPDVYVATGTSVGSNRDAVPANLTLRQNFDAAMLAAATTVGHLLVPLHTDSRIGSYTAWATNGATYWTGDNLHFNAAGYAVMAELFAGAYENLITLVNGGIPATVPGNFLSSMFTATAGSAAGEININVTALPANGGSPITGLEYTLTGGATWGDLPGGAGTGARTITAPAAGTNYNVYIRAKNAVGVGATAQSNAVTSGAGAVTGSAPEPFTSAMWTAVPGATPGTVDVNILSLPSDGGSPLTVLRWSRDSGTTWTNFTGTGTGVRTITLPAAGTSYDIWIAAINAVGNAPGSMKTVTSGAGAVTGSVPGNFLSSMFTATTGSAAGEININVTGLPSDGGSAITKLQYSINSGTSWTDLPGGAGTGARTITAPAASTSYNVYIRAVNAVGNGVTAQFNAATSGAGAVTGSAPSAFTSAQWTAVAGATYATVDVNILSLPSDGGSPITALRWSINGGVSWTVFTGTGTGLRTITLPAAGTEYTLWIAALNAIGPAPGNNKVVTSGA